MAFKNGDQNPEKIDKKLVHKQNIDNVVISKPQKFGNIWHFNMFDKTKEFNFDHESDHMQGMFLIEAARQSGIATMHLNGLPFDGKLNMTEINTEFHNYIEFGSPVIIRSISNSANFDQCSFGKYYIILHLIQFGKVCVMVYLQGMMFKKQGDLENHRTRIVNVNEKLKTKYHSLLGDI